LSESWVQSSERILDQIRKLEKAGEKDRLEHVRSMGFMLRALHRSLLGWVQWVGNPDIMTKFTIEELEKMDKKLSKFASSFIEYDLEVTEKGEEKGLKARRRNERKTERGEIFYV